MNKKYIVFSLGFILTGCVSAPTATEEDALEVAVDDTDNDLSDVVSSSVTEEKGKYQVEFTVEGSSYHYVIGKDGLIEKREFSLNDEYEDKPEEKPKKEETPNELKQESENTDPKQQQAENAALLNAGLSTNDITSISSQLNAEKTEYTVVIVAGEIKTTSVVDANTGEVLSTSFE